MSVSAYRRTIADTESPRDFERRILTRITGELATHGGRFDKSASSFERSQALAGPLRAALANNLKFWTALRLDLMSPANQYPESLRAELISLSLFVERQVQSVTGGRGTVASLVEVNRSILAGMAGDAGTGAPGPEVR